MHGRWGKVGHLPLSRKSEFFVSFSTDNFGFCKKNGCFAYLDVCEKFLSDLTIFLCDDLKKFSETERRVLSVLMCETTDCSRIKQAPLIDFDDQF